VKKGQFMAPAEMANAIEKIRSSAGPSGVSQVLLTERGSFFGYNRLVNDFTGLPQMKALGCPVVFDITHSTQQPAGMGTKSGGNPQYSPLLARAAVAAGVDGLFLECHPEPSQAKSDAATMLDLGVVESLLTQCREIADLRAGWK
jgi:2-dehydro-3-deoxyphosphooctonate aldolase (KDO 8-P synthase)